MSERYKDYHIPGMFWSVMPLPLYISVTVFKNAQFILDWRTEYCLWDMAGDYVRQVNISEMFCAAKKEDADVIVNSISDCDKVYLNLDYIPTGTNQILNDLYWKRVLQVSYYISSKMKYADNLSIVVSSQYFTHSVEKLNSVRYDENIA